jgi:hypothetical protein
MGFIADPDPAFYLNAGPDTDLEPESQTHADQDHGQIFTSPKVHFLHEKVDNRPKTYLRRY